MFQTIYGFLKSVLCFIPMYIVLALIATDWYTFCILFTRDYLDDPASSGAILHWFMLISFNIVVPLLVWSYLKCIFTSTSVEDNPPTDIDLDHVAMFTSNDGNSVRRCRKCDSIKPQRAHHCSMCGTCTLKMDHHCPWVVNCVGWKNYKFFLLFIFYSIIGAMIYTTGGVRVFLTMFNGGRKRPEIAYGFAVVLCTVLTGAFGITLIFFLGFHLHLTFTNRTTLEMSEYSDTHSPWHKGTKRLNFEEIFGRNPWLWLIPINTEIGSGYHFSNPYVEENGRLLDNMPGEESSRFEEDIV